MFRKNETRQFLRFLRTAGGWILWNVNSMLSWSWKWNVSGFSPQSISPLQTSGRFSRVLTADGKCSIPAQFRLARFNSQIRFPSHASRPIGATYVLREESTAREATRKHWRPGVERLEGYCVSRVDPIVESGQARSVNDFAPVEWSSDDSGFHRQEKPKPDSSGGVFLSPDPLRI